MSKKAALSDEERADLVAYLDGELTGEAARAMEAKIALNPAVRAEAESLKRTWNLLDYLPRPEPSPSFTEKTMSRLAPLRKAADNPGGWGKRLRRVALGLGWVAALVVCAFAGYKGYEMLVPRPPSEGDLVRDLRLIENKRYYDNVDDLPFLKKLAQPELFGDDEGR